MQKIYGAKERQDGLYSIGRNKWEIIFGFWKDHEDDENGFNLRQRYTKEPTNAEIINDIFEALNKMCDEKILSGHTFKGMPVWLSKENQDNYETAHNIARDTGGASLPETFKFGGDYDFILYEFKTLEDIDDFYMGCYRFVKECLAECWRYKAEALGLFPVENMNLPEI
jgi:hypothetical protein